jgi:integrase
MLRQTLKTALRHGWLDRLPDFSEPYRSSPRISYRAWFSPEEYKRLYEATRKRAHEPKKKGFTWEAEQLHDYVLFAVNTGLRPDEAWRLEFWDVTIIMVRQSPSAITAARWERRRSTRRASQRFPLRRSPPVQMK